jgi:hypothetical protein
MSSLHQLQVAYDPFQDRLTLTISTTDFQEFQFWITRRCAKIFIDLLDKLSGDAQKQHEAQIADQIAREKEQQQAVAGKFANPLAKRPLGDIPLLVTRLSSRGESEGRWVLSIESTAGKALEFTGDSKISLALKKLIVQSCQTAEWSIA